MEGVGLAIDPAMGNEVMNYCSVNHMDSSELHRLLWLEQGMLRLWELEPHSLWRRIRYILTRFMVVKLQL